MMSADIRPGLANVKVPLLEIGPFDATVDPNNPFTPMPTLAAKQTYYAKLLANDPTAKVEMVDNSRHFIMLDQPAQLGCRAPAAERLGDENTHFSLCRGGVVARRFGFRREPGASRRSDRKDDTL